MGDGKDDGEDEGMVRRIREGEDDGDDEGVCEKADIFNPKGIVERASAIKYGILDENDSKNTIIKACKTQN